MCLKPQPGRNTVSFLSIKPLGEMESDQQSSYPGKILDLAIKRNIITQKESDAIWNDNVLQWLHGDNETAKKELVNKIIS